MGCRDELVGYNFGEILRSSRVFKGLTEAQLAEGICSEVDIIQFEKEEKYPTIDQLFKMASKLEVELNHFFDIASTDTYNYAIAVTELIKKYKRERDYAAINEIIQKEQDNPLFKHTSFNQFLVWHQGICTYYLEGDRKQSIGLLDEALNMTHQEQTGMSEREIEILTSMAIIEKDSGNLDKAVELFQNALNELTGLPQVLDSRIWLRILYGLARHCQSLRDMKNPSSTVVKESTIVYMKKICIYLENFITKQA